MAAARGQEDVRWSAPAGELRDAGLRVRVSGRGPRTFLLLHGLAGSQRYFGASFDVLASEGRLVVPDLLGFGGSPRPETSDYGTDAHADAVLDTLEALGTRPPVYVAAHSIGTLVALRLAVRQPELVRAIVAFGPPLYRTPDEALRHLRRMGLWTRLFATDTVWARIACAWMCRHRPLAARLAAWMRPDLPPEIARDAVEHTWVSYSSSFRQLVVQSTGAADLARVQVPVHLVAGEHDAVVAPAFLSELASTLRHVRLDRWPGGHDLPLTAPHRCVEALRAAARDRERDPRSSGG
jgi:pimeloyl-ACP methyl ester carboxylesterase